MKSSIIYNGELFEEDQALFTPLNRGFAYGDGFFETVRVHQSKIIFWEKHYRRLKNTIEALKFPVPSSLTKMYLEKQIIYLLRQNKLDTKPARVKINFFREGKGLYRPEESSLGYLISTKELLSDSYGSMANQDYTVGVYAEFKLSKDKLSTLKTTNRILNVLGSIYAGERGWQNCLLLNEEDRVVEFLNANLFCIEGKTLRTPPLTEGCLNGIMRREVIDLTLAQNELMLSEEPLSIEQLNEADELFLTNAIAGIQTVTSFGHKNYAQTQTRALLEQLNAKVFN